VDRQLPQLERSNMDSRPISLPGSPMVSGFLSAHTVGRCCYVHPPSVLTGDRAVWPPAARNHHSRSVYGVVPTTRRANRRVPYVVDLPAHAKHGHASVDREYSAFPALHYKRLRHSNSIHKSAPCSAICHACTSPLVHWWQSFLDYLCSGNYVGVGANVMTHAWEVRSNNPERCK
jgi:hypothetical protein